MPKPQETPVITPHLKESTETQQPWNVLILDDPVNLMGYVTLVVQQTFGYSKSKAESLMMQIHQTGKSIVWSGNREHAEFYVQQLQSKQLKTIMEKGE